MSSYSFKFNFNGCTFSQQSDSEFLISGFTVKAKDDEYTDGVPTGTLYVTGLLVDAINLLPDTVKGSDAWYDKEYKRVQQEERDREAELEASGQDYDYQAEIEDVYYPQLVELDNIAEEFLQGMDSMTCTVHELKISPFTAKAEWDEWEGVTGDTVQSEVKAVFTVEVHTCFGESATVKVTNEDCEFEADEEVIDYISSYVESANEDYEAGVRKMKKSESCDVDDGKGGCYSAYYDEEMDGYVIDHIYEDESEGLLHIPMGGVYDTLDEAKEWAEHFAQKYASSKKNVKKSVSNDMTKDVETHEILQELRDRGIKVCSVSLDYNGGWVIKVISDDLDGTKSDLDRYFKYVEHTGFEGHSNGIIVFRCIDEMISKRARKMKKNVYGSIYDKVEYTGRDAQELYDKVATEGKYLGWLDYFPVGIYQDFEYGGKYYRFVTEENAPVGGGTTEIGWECNPNYYATLPPVRKMKKSKISKNLIDFEDGMTLYEFFTKNKNGNPQSIEGFGLYEIVCDGKQVGSSYVDTPDIYLDCKVIGYEWVDLIDRDMLSIKIECPDSVGKSYVPDYQDFRSMVGSIRNTGNHNKVFKE